MNSRLCIKRENLASVEGSNRSSSETNRVESNDVSGPAEGDRKSGMQSKFIKEKKKTYRSRTLEPKNQIA